MTSFFKRPCQWVGPEQDPRLGPMTFCGEESIEGKSYCAHHYPKVYMVGSALRKVRSAGGRCENATPVFSVEEILDELQECYEELVEEGLIES